MTTASNQPRRVCASLYMDPLHIGHLEYLTQAKELAGTDGKLIVIINNDHQCVLKKGRPFMSHTERLCIARSLKMVDEVYLSIDTDRTVCATLKSITPPPTHFVNGGDQTNQSIPESTICDQLGIQLVDGLGDKIQSSSHLTGLIAVEKRS